MRKILFKTKAILLFSLMMISVMLIFLNPFTSYGAGKHNETVRVAYAIVPGYQEGGEGEYKTGYGYEYLQKLASINGWKYEYVYGSFNYLLEMLQKGEVDLMGNITYSEERAKTFFYGTYEQGKDGTYLYVNKKHNTIDPLNAASVDGKKIGVCSGRIQKDELIKWCRDRHISCEILEYEYLADGKEALNSGKIDGLVEGRLQLGEDTKDWDVPFTLNTSSFYFAVAKGRADLLSELNAAQKEILETDPFYNENVQNRYLTPVSLATSKLSASEKQWLVDHDHKIKYGYLEGFLPLCDKGEDGSCKGVAADVFAAIKEQYSEEDIQFEEEAYSDYKTMFKDLRNGKISVAWPAYDDYWVAEQNGYAITDPVVNTSMMLVYDGQYDDDTVSRIGVINTGSLPPIYAHLYYPESQVIEYDSYRSAVRAVAGGEISSLLYVSTTYNVDLAKDRVLQKLNMSVLPDTFGISFAVSTEDEKLSSILNKGIGVFGEAGINHSLIINSAVETKISLRDYYEQHPYASILVVIGIAGIVMSLIYNHMHRRVELTQAEKEIYEHLSNTDSLTGLYNRKAVFAKAKDLIRQYPDESFAVCHVDMKHFRLYNTFFGDEAGDQLLCAVADIFRDMSKDYDHWAYGRIEADVFCLVFPYDEKKFQKHFLAALEYLKNYRSDYLIEPAVGVYFVTDPDMPMEAMFTRATMAAKEVQAHTPYATVIYNEELERELNEKQQIINDMQTALEQEQFRVYLQPKYSLGTDQMVGAEALVRWIHPKKGMISPGRFIPVFEGNGFITALDRYMWEHVCQILCRWKAEGKTILPVSVNVSRISMFGTSTVDFLKELVDRYEIDPSYLQLELTESAYIDDPEEMKQQMLALQKAGFTVLLDDFGSGYSSLNTLRELPVDILKLDMKFLSSEGQDSRGDLVLSSIVRMSKLLNLEVIAEGVERQEQADYLKSIGCESVQGFLYARPMPVEDYENFITQVSLDKE